jgi:hypothetical protein
MSVKIGYRSDTIAYLHAADNAAVDSHKLGSRCFAVARFATPEVVLPICSSLVRTRCC